MLYDMGHTLTEVDMGDSATAVRLFAGTYLMGRS